VSQQVVGALPQRVDKEDAAFPGISLIGRDV